MPPFTWTRWLRSFFRPKGQTFRKSTHRPGVEALENRLAPATYTWSGAGANNSWGTKENWVGNAAPPVSANTLVIAAVSDVLP